MKVGALSQEEIDSCRDAFLAFDKDGSGTIDHWELKMVLEAMGQKPSEEEIFQMIAEVDNNASNSIDFSEFLQVMISQKKKASDGESSDIIDAWVAVGGTRPKAEGEEPSGFVDNNKLIKIIKEDFGLPIDIEKLLEELDEDSSGTIDFMEFKQLLN